MPARRATSSSFAARRLAVEILGAAAADAQRAPGAFAARMRSRAASTAGCQIARPIATSAVLRTAAAREMRHAAPARACGRTRRSAAASASTLPGLSSPFGSNAALDAVNSCSSSAAGTARTSVDLLDADAVLAGDRAAHVDAQLEDLGAEVLGALELAAVVRVEQDQRMQVAVARVEHVARSAGRTSPPSPRSRSSMSARRARGIVPSMQ